MKANFYSVEMAKEWKQLLNAIEVFFKSSARLVQLWLRLWWRWLAIVARSIVSAVLVRPRIMKKVAPGKLEEDQEMASYRHEIMSPPNFGIFR